MSKDFKQLVNDLTKDVGTLGKAIPETMQAFMGLGMAAGKDGALDAKTKELVAMGIAVAVRCDGCIAFHTQKLIKLGVTKEEYIEMLGMAVYMGGGPSAIYAAEALQAYEQLSA